VENLILIDNRFPYESGETFLESEIPFAVANTKNLFIIPLYAKDRSSNRIINIDNVQIINEILSVGTLETLIGALRAFFAPIVWREFRYLVVEKKLSYKNLKKIINIYRLSWIKYLKAKKWIEQQKITGDTVIYSYWLDTGAVVASMLKTKLNNAVAISRAHGFDLYLERNDGYIPFQRYKLSQLDYVFPISEQGTNYLNEQYPKAFEKIITQRLGTNNHGGRIADSDSLFQIASCSNLVALKRVDKILEALSKITDIKIEWHHFGDGSERTKLQELAINVLKSNVRFYFHGNVANAELMKWYKGHSIDIFINVSEAEGLPVSIMEAMSFGIPAIATNVGGTSEIVSDGINGSLLDKEFTVDELVNNIRQFYLMDIDKKNLYRKNARKTWETSFNAKRNYSLFYERLATIVPKNSLYED